MYNKQKREKKKLRKYLLSEYYQISIKIFTENSLKSFTLD